MDGVNGIEVEQIDGEHAMLAPLLVRLDELHHLRDSFFAAPSRLTGIGDPGAVRLLARRDGAAEGFLAGNPQTGHLALVGVVRPRCGVGSALVRAFTQRACAAGAGEVTVVLDTDPHGRWGRRQFFEALGFTAVSGSALHFHHRVSTGVSMYPTRDLRRT
ncbi:hypothetical protein NN3_01240 [Nocardia neocaledoniensis NBRC 108232]|uniref:N-acetyltransferase domain-containing protein n=1 Tax=Nocardia neocaledoniensis TaxID=236511 RepID=A0A317NHU2_9NOCA|nr:hypothetical protein DFR69_106198 [Nocardia neocaledoniensis]GEM29117.1 hypothetical protein NN3_01240 [Nocardia neocaledoniensis NBRC 108232]